MSGGVTTPGRAARTGHEWVRDIEQWRRQQGSAQTVRIGDFVLAVGDDGNLWLHKPGAAPLVVGQEPDVQAIAEQMRGVVVTPDELANVIAGEPSDDVTEDAPTPLERIGTFLENKWTEATNLVTGLGEALDDNPFVGGLTDMLARAINVRQKAVTADTRSTDIVNKAVQAVGNTTGSNFTTDNLHTVLQQQQQQIADINSGLAQVRADQQGQTNSGKAVTVSLAGVADTTDITSLGFAKVSDTGTQNVVVENEAFDMGAASASSEAFLYTADTLLTDYFETSMVMPRPAGKDWFWGPGTSCSYLIGRSDVAGARRCEAQVEYDSVRIGCMVDGTRTWFGAAAAATAPPGALVTFRGGTAGGLRIFQVLINNQLKLTRTDSGNVSYAGEDYRHCGFALQTDGTYRPNNIHTWTMNDNTPAATVGVGYLEVYRGSTSSTAQNNSSFAAFSTNTLDTIDRQTSDIAWDSATQTATVSLPGPYMVTIREQTALDQGDSEEYYCGVIHTSGDVTKQKRGSGWDAGHTTAGDNPKYDPDNRIIGGTPIVLYCVPGDTIQPAHKLAGRNTSFPVNATPQGIVGDAAGSLTWMTIVKLG